MYTGKVKFFNESKGFGFIKDNGSDQEFFVHVSGLKQPVKQNDDVEFEVSDGKKGLMAVNVVVSN
jgi:CspA family cold shock protein